MAAREREEAEEAARVFAKEQAEAVEAAAAFAKEQAEAEAAAALAAKERAEAEEARETVSARGGGRCCSLDSPSTKPHVRVLAGTGWGGPTRSR